MSDNGQPDETRDDEEYPICEGCGERHPSDPAEIVIEVTKRIEAVLQNMPHPLRVSIYALLLNREMAETHSMERLKVLGILSEAFGIKSRVVPPEEPRYVDLSRFTPRGPAN